MNFACQAVKPLSAQKSGSSGDRQGLARRTSRAGRAWATELCDCVPRTCCCTLEYVDRSTCTCSMYIHPGHHTHSRCLLHTLSLAHLQCLTVVASNERRDIYICGHTSNKTSHTSAAHQSAETTPLHQKSLSAERPRRGGEGRYVMPNRGHGHA